MDEEAEPLPMTVCEAVDQFIASLHPDTLLQVRRGDSFGNVVAGKRLRETLSLGDSQNAIVQDASRRYRLCCSEDISGLIIAWATMKIRGQDFDTDRYLAGEGEYWETVGRRYLPGEEPQD